MQRRPLNIQVSMVPDYYKTQIKVPDIQREDTAWSLEQKQLFMDSIFNDYDIPKIYLRVDTDPNTWFLIDGQQRLTAILEFFSSKYPLSDDTSLPKQYHNKYYRDLTPIEKTNFNVRQLDAILLTCTDEEEEDMFLRLNKGTPLSAAEKRNAIRGEMRDAVKNLAKHKFFKSKINFSASRFSVDAVCAQLTLLFIHGGATDTKGRELNELYKHYKKYPEKTKNSKELNNTLTFFDKVFKKKESYLKKYSISSFFLLYQDLKKNYTIANLRPEQFYKFFTEFETSRHKNNNLAEDSTNFDKELFRYQMACVNSPDSESSIRDRHEILLRNFFMMYPDIELKDRKRDFTHAQKEAIYFLNGRKCNGIIGFSCPNKNKDMAFDELQYDHIKEHSQGGKTTVKNGQPLCPSCHAYKTGQYNSNRKKTKTPKTN